MEELVRNPGDNGSEVNREGEGERSVGGLHPSSALLAHESRGEGEEGEQEIRDYRGISTRKNCTCPRTRTGQVNSAVTTQGADYVLSKL